MIAYLTIGIALEGGESGELDAEVGGGGGIWAKHIEAQKT